MGAEMFENYKQVIQEVLSYIPYEDQKSIRELSWLYHDSVQSSSLFQQKTTFNINGSDPQFRNSLQKLDKEIEHLVTPPSRWTRLHFSNLFLERDFMGIEAYFNSFVENYCSGLKCLRLTNCKLGLGRLIELLAFCPELDELEIRRCPSLFSTGVDIVNWATFIPYFNRTLSQLKHFVIEDSGETFLPQNLNSWLKDMRQLIKLELKNTSGSIELPIEYLLQVLDFNKATLRHLSLIGSCVYELSNKDCASLRNLGLKLESLTIGTIKLGDSMNFSMFISQQKNLRYFELQKTTLRSPCFFKISDLQLLEHVVLRDCYLDERSCICLGPLTRAFSVRKLELILTNHQETAEFWVGLFKDSSKWKLQQLHISMSYGTLLLPNIAEYCSDLQELSLVGLGKVFGEPLPLHYIYRLSNLRSLTLKSCGLQDSDFVAEIHNLGDKTLSDLQSLEYLDLSFNEISWKAIEQQVLLLPALRDIIISGTLIQKGNLFQIKHARGRGHWPQLKRLVAQNCRNLRLSAKACAQFAFAFGQIKLVLDVQMPEN